MNIDIIEHMFYIISTAMQIVFDWGCNMDYKEKIIQMINKIDNEDVLRYIFEFIQSGINRYLH